MELIQFGRSLFHGPLIGDGIPPINRLGLMPDHFHRVTAGNTGTLQIADSGPPKIMWNPVADFLDQLAIR